uniref:Leucine rich repeat containing 9 n=1 Tax=Anabas testudineus TaxID=64144 RepID=A0A7N6A1T7_ANATE
MIHSEKQKHRGDEEVVKELCMVNGVSYEKISQEGSNISSLEIFFTGFPRMVGLSFFPRLCQLTIVGQNIKHIEGLECCPLLQELWVVQCHLTGISGLQNCLQLEKLYLYDNEISEITNLELQINLEVLWLNNNCITVIQGLNTLQNLKELNLADNIIEKIGHSLDHNASLENLNLSGNKISSFKELTLLARLPHLTELALKDPMSSPNPLCLLCNYATHVLYHMPGLQRLDTYDVSSKQVKEAAESTVMKKMMYYNMRVRSSQRALAETRFSLTERKKTLQQLPEECIRTLSHALKDLERELSRMLAGCKKSACIVEGDPGGSSHVVDGSASRRDPTTDVSHDPAVESKILFKMEALRERLVFWTRRLNKKAAPQILGTYLVLLFVTTSCTVIYHYRDLTKLNIFCYLPNRFTSCCDLLLSRFSPLDYKIHSITGIKVNRVIRIHNSALRLRFEDKLHSLLSSEDSVIISQNYRRRLEHLFYVADPEKTNEKEDILCILEDGFKTAQNYKVLLANFSLLIKCCNAEMLVLLPVGQIIVAKVFVGHSVPVKEGEPVDRSSYPKMYSVYRNVDTKERTAMSEGIRQWFVFDHELVLPEYIMYFEYIIEDQQQHAVSVRNTDRDETSSNNIIMDKEVLNMEPVLKSQPKLLSLDDKILLNVARANVLSQITVLNLHGNSLSKIKEISRLKALRHLTISFNEFTRLDDISHMPNLEFLDASFNHLVTLEGLRGLGQLKQFDVRWNKLTTAREDTAVLRKHMPSLLKLDTRYNTWNRPESVRMIILGHLTTLTHLDDVMVTEEEAAEAVQMAAGSKINQASLLAHSRTNSDHPRSLSLLSTAQFLTLCSNALNFGQITALNLDSQRISRLINLDKLVNLCWASFNDNDISRVEGLDNCLKLKELSLNNNNISSLSGYLNASLLEQLPNLCFLSVENNCINSLRGIQKVHSLHELYIANNQISTSRDIYYLKARVDKYHHFGSLWKSFITYAGKLSDLLWAVSYCDNSNEVTECESAKDMFGGRLTPDMVAEKLGHSNYTDMTHLTLQSCNIKMVDLSPAELFSSLRSVNLEHNNLTSFSGLIYLQNIKALCLNYNHIESILPRQKVYLTNRQMLYSKVHSSGYGQQSTSKTNREAGATASLEPLMSSLEVLHLSHNGISNMANLQLSRLTNLKALFLQGNEISQVEGLEGLHQLRELVLDRNRIKALAENSFVGQNALLELHLAENRIRELNHLDPLKELRKLFLGLNKLQVFTSSSSSLVMPLDILNVNFQIFNKNTYSDFQLHSLNGSHQSDFLR